MVFHVPPLEAGLDLELTRFGHTIVPNINTKRPDGQVYAKLSFRGAAKDNQPLMRVHCGAAVADFTKQMDIASDYSAANGYFTHDDRAKKNARLTALGHCERLATQVMGLTFNPEPYLENIRRLFDAIDATAAGTAATEAT